jgi:hypothetical protein
MAAPGTAPTILATNQLYPRAVAFADGALFWGNQGDAKLGKWASDSTVSIGGGFANGHINNIVVDSAYVYFSMLISDSNGASPSGAVGRCSISGCGSTLETIATSPDAQLYGLALDSGVLYWSKYAANGSISRLVLDGRSSPETIATGQAMPLQLAAFGGRVYWTSPGTSTVVSVSALGGEPPTILARGQQAPWGIAVDASGVYWTNNDGDHDGAGLVMKLSPGSSTPIPLASGQSRPGHVRIDDAYAYWTNTGNGSIRRVPK